MHKVSRGIIVVVQVGAVKIYDDDHDDKRGELGVPNAMSILSTNAVPCPIIRKSTTRATPGNPNGYLHTLPTVE
jgi:hypothetical protein